MFSPKHPILHSNLKDAAEIFERMEIDGLLEEAYSQREVKKMSF